MKIWSKKWEEDFLNLDNSAKICSNFESWQFCDVFVELKEILKKEENFEFWISIIERKVEEFVNIFIEL